MRILIVEDNHDLTLNLCEFLEHKGHTVDAAADGVTGLHLITVNDYDLIILDLSLPGMDGLEVCAKMRNELGRSTPALMLTGRDTLQDKLAGFDSGTDDYLVKPFELWKDDPPDSDALRTHLHGLRKVIDRPYPSPLIHTVHGIGYRLCRNDAG